MIAAEALDHALGERLGTGPGRWQQQLLGEIPGVRRVTACRFEDPAGGPPVEAVAKVYGDGTGARTARTMAAVRRGLASAPASTPLRVPKPLFYDRDQRLLVQELAPGRPYRALAAGSSRRRHLRAAGAGLASIHALTIPLGRPRVLRDHLDELVRPHPLELAERVPSAAGRVVAVLDELVARERVSGGPYRTLAHRDLHLGQLLGDDPRVWLLDWDLAAAADPALDLGNLIASIATKLPAGPAAACADALLEGYADGDGSGAIARRSLYEGFAFLRLASKRFRLQGSGWPDLVDDLLTRAELALER